MDLSPVARGILLSLLLTAGCASPRSDGGELMRIGDSLREAGDAEGAAGFYRQAGAQMPGDPRPMLRMGQAYLTAGDPVRAEGAFRTAGGTAEARRGLGVSLLAQGRVAEALPLLGPPDPRERDPRAWRVWGVALDLGGRPQEAQAAYRQGLALAPADPDLNGNLALSLALAGNRPGALASMATALASGQPRQRANEVLVLALLGDTAAARRRGAESLGEDGTATLLARAQQALREADAATRARTVGLAGPQVL